MKKVIWTIVLVIALIVSGVAFAGMSYMKTATSPAGPKGGELIPIERITGINLAATLRDGCRVTEGFSMPYDDNGPWEHCGRAVIVGLTDETGDRLPVEGIRIIDVYKDKCTITFMCSDDNKRYYTTDFPLAFLKYDKSKVEKADDGVRTSLPGSRFTLANDTWEVKMAIVLIPSLGVAALSVCIICKKEKAHE